MPRTAAQVLERIAALDSSLDRSKSQPFKPRTLKPEMGSGCEFSARRRVFDPEIEQIRVQTTSHERESKAWQFARVCTLQLYCEYYVEARGEEFAGKALSKRTLHPPEGSSPAPCSLRGSSLPTATVVNGQTRIQPSSGRNNHIIVVIMILITIIIIINIIIIIIVSILADGWWWRWWWWWWCWCWCWSRRRRSWWRWRWWWCWCWWCWWWW